jgi:hypothetical protein
MVNSQRITVRDYTKLHLIHCASLPPTIPDRPQGGKFCILGHVFVTRDLLIINNYLLVIA